MRKQVGAVAGGSSRNAACVPSCLIVIVLITFASVVCWKVAEWTEVWTRCEHKLLRAIEGRSGCRSAVSAAVQCAARNVQAALRKLAIADAHMESSLEYALFKRIAQHWRITQMHFSHILRREVGDSEAALKITRVMLVRKI